jgi:hypothetical protein
MSDEAPWTLIAKRLAGECLESEITLLDQWLSDETNLNLFYSLEKKWMEQQPEETPPFFDAEKGWKRLQYKLE